MAAKPLSPSNPQNPPGELFNRGARVTTKGPNTLRVPTDSPIDETSLWFTPPPGNVGAQGNPMNPIRTGNQVKYMVDGPATFDEMTDAMDTATGQDNGAFKGKDHFIYMLNWFVDDDFELRLDVPRTGTPGQCNSCLHLKVNQAAANGVMVRAMFWDQQLGAINRQNDKAVADINALVDNNGRPIGAAILDARGNESLLPGIPIFGILPMHVGSQHQKILCISGEQGLVAFCGGVDFNPDRVFPVPQQQKGSPMHDVHCRVRGPAAADLLQIFVQRWNDHPEGQKANRPPSLGGKGPLITLTSAPAAAGPQVVQIGRTFGDFGVQLLGIPSYGFAPSGERTAREVIFKAVRNAKRFLYCEDQYFTGSPELESALIATLAKSTFQHLTVVTPHFKISDLPSVHTKRREFIQRLRKGAGKDKVRVFFLRGDASQDDFEKGKDPHTYVHAKLWIADDDFASIGSVNSQKRSLSHDSEVTAGIYDVVPSGVLTYHLAHKLRIELWQEHLNMPGAPGAAELSDGVASGAHWLKPPPGAHIRPYDINEPGDNHVISGVTDNLELGLFNTIIDPP